MQILNQMVKGILEDLKRRYKQKQRRLCEVWWLHWEKKLLKYSGQENPVVTWCVWDGPVSQDMLPWLSRLPQKCIKATTFPTVPELINVTLGPDSLRRTQPFNSAVVFLKQIHLLWAISVWSPAKSVQGHIFLKVTTILSFSRVLFKSNVKFRSKEVLCVVSP